jgi:hypothetical protein
MFPKNPKYHLLHLFLHLIRYYPKFLMNPKYQYFQLFQSFLKLQKYHLPDHLSQKKPKNPKNLMFLMFLNFLNYLKHPPNQKFR